ncbi:hypothetical protein [Roseovarius amoyensis]|uniref:hypothetical protein n=1 Tax=Roseovarius amoyensis TaxID=2211448 RepID=UPI0013A697AF|nr:hypothetical protein [Roseovarius amoyensis]
MLVRILSLALAVTLLGSGAAPAQQDASAIFDVQARITPQLGLAFPGADPALYRYVADAGIGVVRIDAAWKHIEPAPGQFEFRALDRRIAGLQQLGLTPFVTFTSDAEWAVMPATKHLNNATPRDPEAWSRLVARVVERYDGDGADDMPGLRGAVRYWQAANEFMGVNNTAGGWGGSSEELLAYVNLAHDAVKAANPDAIFVLGGLSVFTIDAAAIVLGADMGLQQEHEAGKIRHISRSDLMAGPMREMFENRLKRVLSEARYDIADAHLYGPESRDPARIKALKQLSGHPVLSSECGGPALTYGGGYTGHRHYVSVIERNLNALAGGMRFCLWFGLGEEVNSTWGNSRVQLYDQNRRPKPGVAAYRLLSRLLPAGAGVRRIGDSRAFEIAYDDGRRSHVTLGRAAAATLAATQGGDAMAICVNDAERRQATLMPLSAAIHNCSEDAVVVSGSVPLGLIGAK